MLKSVLYWTRSQWREARTAVMPTAAAFKHLTVSLWFFFFAYKVVLVHSPLSWGHFQLQAAGFCEKALKKISFKLPAQADKRQTTGRRTDLATLVAGEGIMSMKSVTLGTFNGLPKRSLRQLRKLMICLCCIYSVLPPSDQGISPWSSVKHKL